MTGTRFWHSNFGAGANGTFLAGDIIYVGDSIGRVRALRVTDGKEIWRSSGGIWTDNGEFSIAIDNDALYVSNEYGEVHALRTNDGTRIWSLTTGGSTPVLAIARNMVFIGSNNLYAIRATDGKQQWNFPMKALSLATTLGVVYVNTWDKPLRTSSLMSAWCWSGCKRQVPPPARSPEYAHNFRSHSRKWVSPRSVDTSPVRREALLLPAGGESWRQPECATRRWCFGWRCETAIALPS